MMSQLSLVDLSTEILHNIFSFLNACDLAGLGGTCRLFHDFLNRDDLLWQRIYLSRFVSDLRICALTRGCLMTDFHCALLG